MTNLKTRIMPAMVARVTPCAPVHRQITSDRTSITAPSRILKNFRGGVGEIVGQPGEGENRAGKQGTVKWGEPHPGIQFPIESLENLDGSGLGETAEPNATKLTQSNVSTALMNPRTTQNDFPRRSVAKAGTCQDPESMLQERSHPVVWLVFHAIALWSAASFWLGFRRVCAWHQPRPRRMGGNPFARRATHGMCPECFARISAEIISHGETDLRVSVTKAWHTGGPSLLAPPARNCAVPARLQRPSAGDPDTTRPAILRGKII